MSTLYIYPDCKITRDRNCKVDNIQAYLESQRVLPSIEIQYQQIDLHKNLKLNMGQSVVGSGPFNYMEIIQDDKSFYYFIDKTNWKSTNTVEFELTLDTVNTFASDFSFDKKTRITRQHKDRLEFRDNIEEISDVWEYVPTNKELVLNPWASETEYYDTFYIRWDTDDVDCSVVRYVNAKEIEKIDNVYSIEQGYFGQSGVAMKISYLADGQSQEIILEYPELISAFENGIYFVVKFVGNVADMVYDPNGAWRWLFYAYYNRYLMRKIDQVEEGLNPPQFKKGEQDIIDPSGVSWNLVYKSKNPYDENHPEAFDKDNAIECYLYPSDNINITAPGAGAVITAASLTPGRYYYILSKLNYSWGNSKVELKDDDGLYAHVDSKSEVVDNPWTGSGYSYSANYVIIYKSDNDVTVEQWFCNGWAGRNSSRTYTKVNTQTSSSINLISTTNVKYMYSSTYYPHMHDVRGDTGEWSLGSWVTSSLSSIDILDKTDARIIKIIKLPYSFIEYKEGRLYTNDWVAQEVTQGSGQAQTTHYALKLMNTNAKFNTEIEAEYNPLDVLWLELPASISGNRNDNYESKLYNSEFYIPKFVYDSFSYQYTLENIDNSNIKYNSNNIIDYTVTTTVNSRFMFNMNIPLNRSTSDYDGICLVARNNESTIYNSPYINYVRSGYNWDVKNKNLQLGKSLASTGISTAGGILGGLAMGAMTGSATGPVGAIIGGAVGLAGGLINVAFNQAQADNNIKQKLDELSRQAVSVSGSDDIDLLEQYTNGNRAKYCVYECSDRVKQTLLDLFYYCGYKDDIREVPQLDTRKWFNFIQCEPVFNENFNLVYKNYLDDIKQRYQEGVTVYHRVNDSYDWDQEKENWETSLL